jgi:secondary thiamine-phosphate synthase enzyme
MMPISISTREKTELIDITRLVEEEVRNSGVKDGLLMVYCPHTTGAVTINEGADPAVKSDILMVLNKVIPWKEAYRHMEGNSPAHIKSTLVGCSELIAIKDSRLFLGTWQSIYFCEFDGPRSRKVYLKIIQK